MKAKLIKVTEGYLLQELPRKGAGGASCEGTLGSTYGEGDYKLSLKNCQAIELGYDLDELANESSRNNLRTPMEKPSFIYGYKEGFQKAIELLGDKKFSEKDLLKGIELARRTFRGEEYLKSERSIIKSLQQTEWDVEVEMETCSLHPDDLDCEEIVERLKLDSEGCLILKLIK